MRGAHVNPLRPVCSKVLQQHLDYLVVSQPAKLWCLVRVSGRKYMVVHADVMQGLVSVSALCCWLSSGVSQDAMATAAVTTAFTST